MTGHCSRSILLSTTSILCPGEKPLLLCRMPSTVCIIDLFPIR